MVLDDDLFRALKLQSDNYNNHFSTIIFGLLDMIDKAVTAYKELLPNKAKHESIPHILWIVPPTHKNFADSSNEKRTKFAQVLAKVVAMFKNMSMLKLVKVWDPDDGNSFINESYRFTNTGLHKYWMSVDAAIKFWNIALSKKFDKPAKSGKKNRQSPHCPKMGVKFSSSFRSKKKLFRRLPTPP